MRVELLRPVGKKTILPNFQKKKKKTIVEIFSIAISNAFVKTRLFYAPEAAIVLREP